MLLISVPSCSFLYSLTAANRYSVFHLPVQLYTFAGCSALPLGWLKKQLPEPWEGWVQQQVMKDRVKSCDTLFPLSYEHGYKLVPRQSDYGLAD